MKKFPPTAARNKTWANRRKFGAALVEAGAISDADIAAVLDVLEMLPELVGLARERRMGRTGEACMQIEEGS